MGELGHSLNDRELKELIKEGTLIVPDPPGKKIQPTSFEPALGDVAYSIDTDAAGIIRPKENETVYSRIQQLPEQLQKQVDLTKGFELKKGFTYLIPLKEKIRMKPSFYVRSSPKSTYGRIFLNTRLLGDHNPCFDELHHHYNDAEPLSLWLMVQPLAFNVIVHPGASLNQLRFFEGFDARLNMQQIHEEWKKNPLLYLEEKQGTRTPAEPHVTDDGLQMHLDLSGEDTGGIVGLRARKNPIPLDINRINAYDAEDYFEPIKQRGRQSIINENDHYLLHSLEVVKVPPHLNVEVRSHARVGFAATLHFAGFVDPGWDGKLVLEVKSHEIAKARLEHGMPISNLEVFRNNLPEQIYGECIGSHYHRQKGPRPAKFFKEIDYLTWAAKLE